MESDEDVLDGEEVIRPKKLPVSLSTLLSQANKGTAQTTKIPKMDPSEVGRYITQMDAEYQTAK